MSCSPEDEQGGWAAIGPGHLLGALAPLYEEHRCRGAAALIPGVPHDLATAVSASGARPSVLLVVEDPVEPSIRPAYTSPFITMDDGAEVLLGWLRLEQRELAAYALRAAALLRRRSEEAQAIVLLGPREQRYLDLLDKLERITAPSPDLKTCRWSAERIRKPTLLHALRLGAAALLYTGHGNADGWFAYGGLDAGQFTAEHHWSNEQTSALMFSLACGTGEPLPPGTGGGLGARRGFADGMVGGGVAGAMLAPAGDPLHADNCRLAAALLRAFAHGCRSLRDVLATARAEDASLRGYAVIGDPALSAAAAPGAWQRGAKVFAPAADADLASAARDAMAGAIRCA